MDTDTTGLAWLLLAVLIFVTQTIAGYEISNTTVLVGVMAVGATILIKLDNP